MEKRLKFFQNKKQYFLNLAYKKKYYYLKKKIISFFIMSITKLTLLFSFLLFTIALPPESLA